MEKNKMENKKFNGIEKLLNGLAVSGGLTAGYIAISDFMQLNEVNLEGLYCITQDPRMLISAGIGLSAYAMKKIKNSYSQTKLMNIIK